MKHGGGERVEKEGSEEEEEKKTEIKAKKRGN